MSLLYTCITLVGMLCLLDMLMTFAVIRRLRIHTELLAGRDPVDLPIIGVPVGGIPAAGPRTTLAGEPLDGLAGLRLVAFFSTSCSACPEQVAPFVAYVSGHRLPRQSVLAVVVRTGDEVPAYLDQLTAVAQVCAEHHGGDLGAAFGLGGFPAFCLLGSDGSVLASGSDPANLPVPAVAS